MSPNKTHTKFVFQSFLDLFLAVLIGNLLALPFLIFAIYHLPASNEIRIGVLEFPDNDDLVWKWYRDKYIEPVEIIREDSILKITYKAKLSDSWEVPNSIELENMGYAFSGQYVFDKNPYSDIISNINKDRVASILEPLAADMGRLFIILIVASQLGFLIIG